MTSALRISLAPEIICPDICWLHWLLPNCHQMIADGFQDYILRDLNVWLKTHFLSRCGSRKHVAETCYMLANWLENQYYRITVRDYSTYGQFFLPLRHKCRHLM